MGDRRMTRSLHRFGDDEVLCTLTTREFEFAKRLRIDELKEGGRELQRRERVVKCIYNVRVTVRRWSDSTKYEEIL